MGADVYRFSCGSNSVIFYVDICVFLCLLVSKLIIVYRCFEYFKFAFDLNKVLFFFKQHVVFSKRIETRVKNGLGDRV